MPLLVVLFKMMEGCYIGGSIWTKSSILMWLLGQAGSCAWAEFSCEGVECLGGRNFLGKILCMRMVNPRLSSCWHFWAVKNKLLNKWKPPGTASHRDFGVALVLFGVGGLQGTHCQLSLVKHWWRLFSLIWGRLFLFRHLAMWTLFHTGFWEASETAAIAICFLVISCCLQIPDPEDLPFSELSPSCSLSVSEMRREPRIIMWIAKLAAV